MNDKLARESADKKLAVRIGLAFGDDARQIDYAHRLYYGRPAGGRRREAGQSVPQGVR